MVVIVANGSSNCLLLYALANIPQSLDQKSSGSTPDGAAILSVFDVMNVMYAYFPPTASF
jgi:hypothetical protein